MYYFLTQMLDWNLSGIEVAQRTRLRLFKDHQIAAKIATRDYNRYLHLNIRRMGLTDADVVNLFDFFQGVETYTGTITHVDDLHFPGLTRSFVDGWRYLYQDQGKLRVEIHVFTDQTMYEKDQVEQVIIYDRYGHVAERDLYDVRGFLSSIDWYSQRDGIAQTDYLNTTGTTVLSVNYTSTDQPLHGTWRLTYQGQQYFFGDLDELNTFFYDTLNEQNVGLNTFIGDRTEIVDPALLNMKTQARRFDYVHNIQVEDPNNPLTSPLGSVFKNEADQSNRLNALIVPTNRQREDLTARMPAMEVVTARQVYVSPQPVIPMGNRKRGKILCVARIHPQKGLEDLISAFAKVHQQLPFTTLEIRGYVNDEALNQRLHQQVVDLGLADVVSFEDYLPSLSDVYDSAQAVALTSRYEGLPMTLVEGLSHGVPLAAYDCNYGPAEVVQDGLNGHLVANFDIDGMAAALIDLLADEAQLNQWSERAYRSASRFSEDNIWQEWQSNVIDNHERDHDIQ